MSLLKSLLQRLFRPASTLPEPASAPQAAVQAPEPTTAVEAPLPAGHPRVFGIGLSKTGTTTLGTCFEILGLGRRCSYSLEHTLRLIEGDVEGVLAAAERYEALEDSPWFAVYEQLAQRHPQARFILTRRKDGAAWVRSALNHGAHSPEAARELGRRFFERLLPGVPVDALHDTHNARVRAFFAEQPHRLLEVCWEEEASWDALCAFLGRPLPDQPFPHENQGVYAAAAADAG